MEAGGEVRTPGGTTIGWANWENGVQKVHPDQTEGGKQMLEVTEKGVGRQW